MTPSRHKALERIRWFFALPDPREDDTQKSKAVLSLERYNRQIATPLGRFAWRCHDLWEWIQAELTITARHIWHGTLGRRLFIKSGYLPRTEMANMRFVASKTTIPVPRIWMCIRWKGRDYMVMTRIKGVPLDTVWNELPQTKKDLVADQVRGFVAQLRAVHPPADHQSICSVTGGSVVCYRLYNDGVTGPFRDEAHMNLQLRRLRPPEDYPEVVQRAHARLHPLVFTHNDLAPRNIMYDVESGKILALIDWESAGWFPEHWEYCKTLNWVCDRPSEAEWKKMVPSMMPVYKEEAEADWLLMYKTGSSYLSPMIHAP